MHNRFERHEMRQDDEQGCDHRMEMVLRRKLRKRPWCDRCDRPSWRQTRRWAFVLALDAGALPKCDHKEETDPKRR